ncbi:pentapeptide repeat-containing protein [Bradyrhizobium manausense]|uniref:pentapeptide repeat-containing protein n=1 Tax=Bradyrhizobium TaxID=374 RepID=UPI001BABF3A2|nr:MULTISPECIES: pentapeptide repeat-containing protein [Bradyrhizobium]MBR0828873.1 pentapeptide repeat-containing protein [Bradyrhizobium manausense]UVO28118.1 pentapeptide repeat-containing protein [Bradyrhizobium arachidis]
MHQAFALWGYSISAGEFLAGVAIYLAVAIAAIVLIPRISVRGGHYHSLDAKTKIADLRGKVRQSVIQVVGGITAVAAFIVTIQQIRDNEDTFKGKKADLLANSISGLFDDKAAPKDTAKAMYLLSYIATSDPSYHRIVYDALATHVRTLSGSACRELEDSETMQNLDLQLALRVIGDRSPSADPTKKRINLEGSCLIGADIRDEPGIVAGLRRARLSNSLLYRADFTGIDLTGAELKGIYASDYKSYNFQVADGYQFNRGVEGDDRGNVDWAPETERRKHILLFVGATLTDVDFQTAELAGADFSRADLTGTKFLYANISRANFIGAKGLDKSTIRDGCVGNKGFDDDEMKRQQPYFSKADREKIGPIKPCP